MKLNFDTLILGGGPAGFATGIPLVQAGFKVLLVDLATPQVRKGEMLTPKALHLLDQLGCKEDFEAGNHLEGPGIISSWGSPEPFEADFIRNPWGSGWFIERSEFEVMLASQFSALGGQLKQVPVKCTPNHTGPGQWELEVNGTTVTSRTLVYATGRGPLPGNAMGKISLDKQVGLLRTGHRADPKDRDCRLQVEATEGGWWYLAFYPGGQVVVAFMTDADLLPKGQTAKADLFHNMKATAPCIYERLTRCTFAPGFQTVAASTFIRKQVAGYDWLAVGDAALGIDPLSGQGITKAMRNGLKAAETLQQKLTNPEYPMTEYALDLLDDFQRNSQERTTAYLNERRWPNAPFWARRHEYSLEKMYT